MSPKLAIAACLVLTLLPLWIGLAVADLTRKGAALCVLILVAAAGCFLVGGFTAAVVAVAAGYLLCIVWGVPKAVVLKLRRARLADGSSPERADLERWARKALREQDWTVEYKTGPARLFAWKKGLFKFHVVCVPDYESLHPVEVRNLYRFAMIGGAPVILLLFGGAPATLVNDLRRYRLLPISYADLPRHAAVADSLDAFVKSCRSATIEDVVAPPMYHPTASLFPA